MPQPTTFSSLAAAAAWYDAWLRDTALPLWAAAGVDARRAAFVESLTNDGLPTEAPRRARVQARQAFVYATAAQAGFGVSWLPVATHGFAQYAADYQQPDGLFAAAVDGQGKILDPACALYEQDFSLLAMAALHTGGVDQARAAVQLRNALQTYRHPAGGFREIGGQPFQSNAHMHLLESAMAWEAAGGDDGWRALADEIVDLALTRFIDPQGGFLREFFAADWAPAPGDDGRWVEPGHQFEWAWLLERWGLARSNDRARAAARRLFACGIVGVDAARGVAIDVCWDDLSPRDANARLWPQTEYLKAALILGEDARALAACNGLAKYLAVQTPGAWRDKMNADGSFVDEPAPASSFYHIVVALLELFRLAH